MVSDEHKSNILYFQKERGDVERYCSWDAIKEDVFEQYPLIKEAERLRVLSEKMWEGALRELSEELGEYY